MLIDRTKFLLLATSIATASCTVVNKNPDEETEESDDEGDAGGSDTDEETDTPTDDETDETDEGTDAEDGGRDEMTDAGGDASDAAVDAGAPTDDAMAPMTDGGAGDGGGSDADVPTDAGHLACLGDEGSLPSCDGLAESSLDSFQMGECEGAATTMKAGVAAQYRECMLAQSSEELEDATNTYTCKLEAALSACEDEESLATCEEIQDACPEQDIDECRDHVNGLTAEGRAEMIACSESSCFGIYSCLEGL